MEKLMEAIQLADIPMVTVKLYSKEVISENTYDKVLLPNLTRLEKNGILLRALRGAIKTQPQVLLTLLDILNEFKPADLILSTKNAPTTRYVENVQLTMHDYCL